MAMEAVSLVVPRLLECAALLAVGYQLRASRIFTERDGEVRSTGVTPAVSRVPAEDRRPLDVPSPECPQTAYRLAQFLTVPAAILQACST